MIRSLVDFAIDHFVIVIGAVLVIFVGGAFSFKRLPVEAYPDVANTWVQVITQWPGHAAEEVERLVTLPTEVEMNGTPNLEVARSISLYELSDVILTFQEATDDYFATEKSRKVDFLWRGRDRIADVDVDMEVEPCGREVGPK